MEQISTKSIGIDGEVFAERRADARRRVFKGGRLSFNKGYGALECVVRNLSEGGARLNFGDTSAVPPRFDLAIGDDPVRAVQVRWRRMTEIGVAFETV